MEIEDIALFDMNERLCDYSEELASELRKIQAQGEPVVGMPIKADVPNDRWPRCGTHNCRNSQEVLLPESLFSDEEAARIEL